jgi:multiple sugar transport system permease protein
MKKEHNMIWYIIIICFLLETLFPIYWMLCTSLKGFDDVYSLVPKLIPKKIETGNYISLFSKYTFLPALVNSIVIAAIVSVITIVVSIFSAYAVVRLNFRGKRLMPQFFLMAYLVPSTVLFIPIYLLLAKMGLLNSVFGLIVIYPTITIPYATWVLITFFQGLGIEMEEAAFVDGATRMQTIWHIVLPVTRPTIVSTLIFSFTLCWSEYIYALVLINDKYQRTITVALSSMLVADIIPWGALSAGAVICALPIMIVYIFASKYIVSGLTIGSVKG